MSKPARDHLGALACQFMASRMRIKPVAIVLVVVAIVLVIIGIIYLTQTANHLPGFIPGKPGAKELKLPICNAGKKNADVVSLADAARADALGLRRRRLPSSGLNLAYLSQPRPSSVFPAGRYSQPIQPS